MTTDVVAPTRLQRLAVPVAGLVVAVVAVALAAPHFVIKGLPGPSTLTSLSPRAGW